MAKLIVLLLIVVVIAGVIWVLSGRNRKPGRHTHARTAHRAAVEHTPRLSSASVSQLEKMREGGRFWGVNLQNPGCDASMKLHEQEIPLVDAPTLPLPDCDSMQCSCSWKGLTQKRRRTRRTQSDRRDGVRYDEFTQSDDMVDSSDRRSHKERRKSESTWDRRDF